MFVLRAPLMPRKAPRQSKPQPLPQKPIGLYVVVAVVVGAVLWLGLRNRVETPSASRATAQAEPATPPAPVPSPRLGADWDPSWHPLPGAGASAPDTDPARAAYAFVARHPEVVRHIPCFCGCSRAGHQSVESCFVKERPADGKPIWNPMGFG
jgi:hypothetical protein